MILFPGKGMPQRADILTNCYCRFAAGQMHELVKEFAMIGREHL